MDHSPSSHHTIEKAGSTTSLLSPFPIIEIKKARLHSRRPLFLVCDVKDTTIVPSILIPGILKEMPIFAAAGANTSTKLTIQDICKKLSISSNRTKT